MFEVAEGPGAKPWSGVVPVESAAELRVSGRRGREARWIRRGSPGEVMQVLKAARDQSGLSNREIAQELGISKGAVCELIQGRKHPSLLLVVRWLGVCGWDLLAVER